MSYTKIAERQFGLVTTDQLRASGLSDRAISHRVKVGGLIPMLRRVFRVPGVPFDRDQVLLGAQLSVPGAVLSHRSAGAVWLMKGFTYGRPEVTVTVDRAKRPGIIVYRSRHLAASDTTTKGPFTLTTPSRTLLDLAAVLDRNALEFAVDSAIGRRLLRLEDLQRRIVSPARGVQGVGMLRAIVVDRVDFGRPASFLETKAVIALRKAELPRPISQFEIRRPDGSFVARPDLVYPDIKLAIELDGDEYHATRVQRRADLARQNELTNAGYAFLRFGDDAVADGRFVASVRDYLRRA